MDSLSTLEKIILFSKAFVKTEYKEGGGDLGHFEFNEIYIDDRATDALQITTVIHELSHFLLAEILEQDKKPRKKSFVQTEGEDILLRKKNPFIEKLNRGEKVFVVENLLVILSNVSPYSTSYILYISTPQYSICHIKL